MAFCVFCGNKIEDDQLFCGYCGADLSVLRKRIEEESRKDSSKNYKKMTSQNNASQNNTSQKNVSQNNNVQNGVSHNNAVQNSLSHNNNAQNSSYRNTSYQNTAYQNTSFSNYQNNTFKSNSYKDNSFKKDSTQAKNTSGNKVKSAPQKKGFLVSMIVSLVILLAASGLFVFYLKKRDFQLFFDDKTFSATSIDGMDAYEVSTDTSVLSGKLEGSVPKKLAYCIYGGDNYIIKEGEIDPEKEWKIEDVGLVVGQNFMVVEADYLIGSPKIKAYVILNYEQKNEDRLGLNGLDSDGDGLSDLYEIKISQTSPQDSDTDKNGISDADEDFDEDGLTNVKEEAAGTSSLVADSDLDGVEDGKEIELGTNPNVEDTDGDGVVDGNEVLFNLNPNAVDEKYDVEYNAPLKVEDDVVINVSLNTDVHNEKAFSINAINSKSLVDIADDGIIKKALVFNGINSEVKLTVEESKDSMDVYQLDRKTGDIEKIGSLDTNDNIVSVAISDFRNIIILGKQSLGNKLSCAKNKNNIDKNPNSISDELPADRDSDGDGFNDEEDPTPYTADVFKTYEDYLNYFYSNDVIGFMCSVPYTNSPSVADIELNVDLTKVDTEHFLPQNGIMDYIRNVTGHSWVGYSVVGEDGYVTDISGFFGEVGRAEALQNKDFNATLRTTRVIYSYDVLGKVNKKLGTNKTYVNNNNRNLVDNVDKAVYILPLELDSACIKDPSLYKKYTTYLDNYFGLYNLYKNNCTTYALECVKNFCPDVKIYASYSKDESLLSIAGDMVFARACSPGQAGYCITQNYPDTYVYREYCYKLPDGKENYGFTSKMAKNSSLYNGIQVSKNDEKESDVVDNQATSQDEINTDSWQPLELSKLPEYVEGGATPEVMEQFMAFFPVYEGNQTVSDGFSGEQAFSTMENSLVDVVEELWIKNTKRKINYVNPDGTNAEMSTNRYKIKDVANSILFFTDLTLDEKNINELNEKYSRSSVEMGYMIEAVGDELDVIPKQGDWGAFTKIESAETNGNEIKLHYKHWYETEREDASTNWVAYMRKTDDEKYRIYKVVSANEDEGDKLSDKADDNSADKTNSSSDFFERTYDNWKDAYIEFLNGFEVTIGNNNNAHAENKNARIKREDDYEDYASISYGNVGRSGIDFLYIDDDKIPEMILKDDWTSYIISFYDGKLYASSVGTKYEFNVSEKNGVLTVAGGTGWHNDVLEKLEKGKLESVAAGIRDSTQKGPSGQVGEVSYYYLNKDGNLVEESDQYTKYQVDESEYNGFWDSVKERYGFKEPERTMSIEEAIEYIKGL